MKAYLATTAILFGLMAVLHVWRAVDEWPGSTGGIGFVLIMAALIALPGLLCGWACCLLWRVPGERTKQSVENHSE
jgi:hypothetical protein